MKTSLRPWLAAPAAALLLFAAPAPGAATPAEFDARAVLDEAGAQFRKAVDLSSKDSAAAARHAARAAAAYREIAVRTGVRNHALEVNAGNASLLAGDLGHAVAAFRRAERIAPRNPAVQASLAAARARVGLRVEPDTRWRLATALLAWRGTIARPALLWVTLGAYLGVWAAAGARRRWGRPGAWAGLTLGAVALAGGVMLAADDLDVRDSSDAVVVAPEVVGRGGPGEGLYEPSFKQPLRAGVECRVVETRGPWSRVRLIDGRETWLPAAALEPV